MRRVASIVVALLVSAVGVSLAPAASVAAQASCTNYSLEYDNRGSLVAIPTIGGGTRKDDCLLGVGNDSVAVTNLQFNLNICYGSQLKEDGIFGPKTEEALRRAQRAEHIPDDGVYGPQTRDHLRWEELFSYTCRRL